MSRRSAHGAALVGIAPKPNPVLLVPDIPDDRTGAAFAQQGGTIVVHLFVGLEQQSSMSTQLPTRNAFLHSLGPSYLDDQVLAVASLLDEVQQLDPTPLLQALALCDVFKHCVQFRKNELNQRSPFVTPYQQPEVQLPSGPPRTRQRSGNVQVIQRNKPLGRARSGDVLPQFTQNVSSPGATVVRRQILDDLERRVTAELCGILQCSPNVLPSYIEERFCIGMSPHGERVDSRVTTRHRLGEAERIARKVTFHGGLAFMLRAEGGPLREVPADTTDYAMTSDGKHRRYCHGFVFAGGTLYLENHGRVKELTKREFFHSSYMDGGGVDCAGDISFLQGKLTSLSNFSGHYQPEPRRLVPLIRFLQARGMNTSETRLVHADDGSMFEFSTPDPEDIAGPGSPLPRTVAEFLETGWAKADISPRALFEP